MGLDLIRPGLGGQQAQLGQHARPLGGIQLHLAQLGPGHALRSVQRRQLGVHHRERRRQQGVQLGVGLPDLADEPLGLLAEQIQVLVLEVGVGLGVLVGLGQFAQLQPLRAEVGHHHLGLGVAQQALRLLHHLVARAQLARPGRVQQGGVGHRPPQQVRQPRGHLPVGQPGVAGAGHRHPALQPVVELRRQDHDLHHGVDAVGEAARLVVGEHLLQIVLLGGLQRPAPGAGAEAIQELVQAGALAILGRVTADQRAQLALDRLPDLLGRPDVRLGQPVGDRPKLGVVVEAVLHFLGREVLGQRQGLAQQVADRVVVFHPGQAAHGRRPGADVLADAVCAVGRHRVGADRRQHRACARIGDRATARPGGGSAAGTAPARGPRRAVRAAALAAVADAAAAAQARQGERRYGENRKRCPKTHGRSLSNKGHPRPLHPPSTYSSVRASSLLFLLSGWTRCVFAANQEQVSGDTDDQEHGDQGHRRLVVAGLLHQPAGQDGRGDSREPGRRSSARPRCGPPRRPGSASGSAPSSWPSPAPGPTATTRRRTWPRSCWRRTRRSPGWTPAAARRWRSLAHLHRVAAPRDQPIRAPSRRGWPPPPCREAAPTMKMLDHFSDSPRGARRSRSASRSSVK